MRVDEAKVLSIVVLLLTACLTVLTFELSPVSRLVPQYVVVATLAISLLNVARAFRGSPSPGQPSSERSASPVVATSERPSPVVETSELPSSVVTERPHAEARVLLWVLALPLGTLLIGLAPAVLLYAYVYLRRWTRVGRPAALAAGVCLAGTVYGLGYIAVNQGTVDGLLWTLLGVSR